MHQLALSMILMTALAAQPLLLQSQSLSQGLVLCYLMDGDALDASINSLHGSTNAQASTDRNGTPGGALAFNGINTYLDLPISPLLKPSFPFTVSLWMKANNHTGGLYTSDYYDDVYAGFWLAINSDATLNANYGNGGVIGSASRRSEFSVMQVAMNQWYQVTAVFNGLNNVDLYVGCEQVATVPSGQALAMNYTLTNGSLGRHDSMNNGPPGYFNGVLDEVALWNRALTQWEINLLCSTGLANAVSIGEHGYPSEIMKLCPNPTSERLVVSGIGVNFNGRCSYVINHASGRTMMEGNLFKEQMHGIDVSALAPGPYVLMIATETGEQLTSRFIVVR